MKSWNHGLLRWILFAGIAYPLLCAISMVMMISGGIMPEPDDPPVPWHITLISGTGRGLAAVLMSPLLVVYKFFPGRSVPGIDYVWLFFLGMLIGVLCYYLKRFVKNAIKKGVS